MSSSNKRESGHITSRKGTTLGRDAIPADVFYAKRTAPSNFPKTPPKSRVPRPGSTPIVRKIGSDYTYSSEVKHQTKLNEELAKEMEGRFLGPMPPDRFLDTYLPLDSSFKLPTITERERDQILSLPVVKVETEMYKPLIKALDGCTPGLVLGDTHAHPDPERGGLAPDISLYHQNDLPKGNSTTDFSKMSVFIELKLQKDSDPFCDPDDPLQPKAKGYRFERAEQAATQNRGQIGSYAAALAGSQFRVHLFSVLICGPYARFIRWDRTGAIVTRRFDYTEKPDKLRMFFWRYSHLDPCGRGYDLTNCVASDEDIKRLGNFEADLRWANAAHREFRKLMVPDRNNPNQESGCIISYPTYYESRSPFSRATRAMIAYDLVADQLVFLKDYWRADVEGMDKEGDIYALLEQAKVPNIAPFGSGNDVKNHATITQNLRNEIWACETIDMICLRLYRMTLKVIGRELTEFSSSKEFVSATADAMEAHDGAFFDAGVLHRDISVGNILITDEGRGLLIDWDLCINLNREKEEPRNRAPMRTGTWQFMSATLLKDPSTKHGIEDDRESSFYVLLWTALRYSKHRTLSEDTTTPRDDVAGLLLAFDEVYTEISGNVRGGTRKAEALMGKDLSNIVQFYRRPKLDELLTALQDVFAVRYRPSPKEDALKQYKMFKEQGADEGLLAMTIPHQYFKALEKLKQRGWLVETMRAFLDNDEWPEADKAEPQDILPQTTSKRKLMQDQISLRERVSKRRQVESAPAPVARYT